MPLFKRNGWFPVSLKLISISLLVVVVCSVGLLISKARDNPSVPHGSSTEASYITQNDPISIILLICIILALVTISIGLLVAGLVLVARGVQGHTTWKFNFMGISSEVTDVAPGVIFGLMGFLLLCLIVVVGTGALS